MQNYDYDLSCTPHHRHRQWWLCWPALCLWCELCVSTMNKSEFKLKSSLVFNIVPVPYVYILPSNHHINSFCEINASFLISPSDDVSRQNDPGWYYMWHVTRGAWASMFHYKWHVTRGAWASMLHDFELITWWLLHLSTDKSIMNAVGDQKELIRSKGSDQFDLPQQIIHPLPHMMLSRTSTHVIEWWMVV